MQLQSLMNHDFLGEIIIAWQHIQYKPTPTFDDKPIQDNEFEANLNRLPIIDMMANSPLAKSPISTDRVRQWREQLLEVIDSLREGIVEF